MIIENGVLEEVNNEDIIDGKFTVPEGVTSIGESAFVGCGRLTEISIPEGVTSIGAYAFAFCRSLTEIKLPEGVTSVGNHTFHGCCSLTGMKIPKGVTSIGDSAFRGCKSLTEIEIPEGVTSIGEGAFSGCKSLVEIKIPEGVTSIGDNAFFQCSSLTEIEIPEGVTSIGNFAFRGCKSLTKIKISEGVTSIGEGAFSGCESLVEIKITEGVTSIGDGAFRGCSSLTEIEIPEGVTSIGDGAFSGCSSLTEIEIPEGVTSIGDSAFYDCSSLTKIKIPKGVTSIGDAAFRYCASLTEIRIPEGVICIGEYAFYSCRSLKDIYIPASVEKAYVNRVQLRKELEKFVRYGDVKHETENPGKIEFESIWRAIYNPEKDNEKIELFTLKELEIKNIIPKELSEKEKNTMYSQIVAIYLNPIFKQSENYDADHAMDYLDKMISLFGLQNTYNMLKIPENISVEEMLEYSEEISKIYKAEYKIEGDLKVLLNLFEDIDTVIAKNSNNVRNDRNRFYTKFNQILESKEKISVEELLKKCFLEIGIEIEESVLKKIKNEIQTERLTEKKDKIKSKINEKISIQEQEIVGQGVSKTLLYNVIRKNILQDGKTEDIEEILHRELYKQKENEEYFYGEAIRAQEEKYKQLLEELYLENKDLLDSNIVDILSDTKEKVGKGWILKLKEIKNSVRNIEKMTEEEMNSVKNRLEQIGITPSFNKQYGLNSEITIEEIAKILEKEGFRDILTYEKAEMITGGIAEPYSKNFAIWFMEHQKEIIKDAELCDEIHLIHNAFENMLEDPNVRATFDNKKLSIQKVFDIYNRIEKEVSFRK